jgi:cyclopropane-fatty-acyl-phospholipid synthase
MRTSQRSGRLTEAGLGTALAERGLVPLPALRAGIRRLVRRRLAEAAHGPDLPAVVAMMGRGPVALGTEAANAQHYEVPAAFFRLVLGRHLKYSSGYWTPATPSLDAAEEAMLALTCDRAGLADGQRVLELGCGWGSLTLWMARRFPGSRFVAVSNSASQRAFIEAQGLPNLQVLTADMNHFDVPAGFDRVVSVEMFEHMRNWPALLRRVSRWLVPGGQAFLHVFCHRRHAYTFETDGADDWMGRHFFTGGLMPAFGLLDAIGGPMPVAARWFEPGTHYARTAAAWRGRLEARRGEVLAVFRDHYGRDAARWFHRWRLFFLACEELFGFADGQEWGVGHFLLDRAAHPGDPAPPARARHRTRSVTS